MQDARSRRLRNLLTVSILGAIGGLLMAYVHFPLLPGAPWLLYDPSAVAALIAAFAMGPWEGFMVIIIKSVIFCLIRFHLGDLVGIPAGILAGGSLVVVAGLMYRSRKTRSFAILSLASGVLVSTSLMIPFNYYLFPVFQRLMTPAAAVIPPNVLMKIIMVSVIPFNLLQGLINGFLIFLIYKRVAGVLRMEI